MFLLRPNRQMELRMNTFCVRGQINTLSSMTQLTRTFSQRSPGKCNSPKPNHAQSLHWSQYEIRMSTRIGFVFRQIKYQSTLILRNHQRDFVSLPFGHLSCVLQRMEFYDVIETTPHIGTIVSLQQGTYYHGYICQVLCSL